MKVFDSLTFFFFFFFFFFRYFLVNYESPASIQFDIKEYLQQDLDVITPNIILRKEETTYSPDFIPCIFGELPNPEHEKRVWRSKILRQLKLSRKNKDQPELQKQQ